MQPHTRLKPSTRRPILPANSVSHLQAKRDMPGPPDCQTPSFPSTSFTSSTYPTDPSKGRFSSSTPLFVPRFSTRVLFIQSQRRVSRFWSPPIWEGPPPPWSPSGRARARTNPKTQAVPPPFRPRSWGCGCSSGYAHPLGR